MQSKVHQATVDPFTSQYVINNQKLDSGKCLPHAREYGLPSQVTKALKADLGVVVELFALLLWFPTIQQRSNTVWWESMGVFNNMTKEVFIVERSYSSQL